MKLLHTSDWHLGAALYDAPRYGEHKAFLVWLTDLIASEHIDVLLVAGDIFDKVMPPNEAAGLYYSFLADLGAAGCRQAVITGGNHDSPSRLNAPADVLKGIGVRVIGCMPGSVEEEVIPIRDRNGRTAALVCAVPYLRDRDVRVCREGDDPEDRETAIAKGVAAHYAAVREAARKMDPALPLIAMGHLFAGGALARDGESPILVGTLGKIPTENFAGGFAYVALGHIHSPQKLKVGGQVMENVRYCGSPIPMSFDETAGKEVVILDIGEDGFCGVQPVPVPRFRELKRLSGGTEDLRRMLRKDVWEHTGMWLDIRCAEGTSRSLRENLDRVIAEEAEKRGVSPKDRPVILHTEAIPPKVSEGLEGREKDLASLTPDEVFEKLLDSRGVREEERGPLRGYYQKVLRDLEEHPEGAPEGRQGTETEN